jgi:thiamine biosynthesis lipoprotein
VTRRARPLLGTFVEIGIDESCRNGESCENEACAFERAFGAIEHVQKQMSFHDPDSDLSRLNRSAHKVPQPVPKWMWRVLKEAGVLYEKSFGLFDPAVAPRLVEAGVLPAPGGSIDADRTARFSDVKMLADGTVVFKRPLWLDLGGIAKGFAVDVAISTLRASGIHQAWVNAGGDLRVFGRRPQAIHIRNPHDPAVCLEIGKLSNGACATSAGYFSDDESDLWSIIDASGGRLDRQGSVSVIARKCIWADGLTKVVALAPPQLAQVVVDQFRAKAIVL